MLRKNKNKNKPRLPTREEMLSYRPVRADIKWEEDKEGLIYLKVEKFQGNLGKSLCGFVRKDNYFRANLDKIGSAVWKSCDGRKTVGDILKILEKKFPDEENIDNRLFVFLQQLNNLSYIDY